MAFGGGLDNDEEVMKEINVTPLVDVMLVLLIIFILTIPVLTHTVELNLPEVSSQPSQTSQENIITIAIARNGSISWNNETLSEDELTLRFHALLQQENPPEIQIRGDQYTDYGNVVKIMALAQESGIKKLGFITKPDAYPEN